MNRISRNRWLWILANTVFFLAVGIFGFVFHVSSDALQRLLSIYILVLCCVSLGRMVFHQTLSNGVKLIVCIWSLLGLALIMASIMGYSLIPWILFYIPGCLLIGLWLFIFRPDREK